MQRTTYRREYLPENADVYATGVHLTWTNKGFKVKGFEDDTYYDGVVINHSAKGPYIEGDEVNLLTEDEFEDAIKTDFLPNSVRLCVSRDGWSYENRYDYKDVMWLSLAHLKREFVEKFLPIHIKDFEKLAEDD